MAIAFTCPSCGAQFRVADSVGGKKVKCRKCEGVIAVPAARPAAPPPRPSSIDDEDEGYELDERAAGRSSAGERPSYPAGVMPFASGARISQLSIVECEPERFVLANTAIRVFLVVIGGAAALIAGLWLVNRMVHAAPNLERPVRVPRLLAMLPFALVGFGAAALCGIARLGYRMTFDREEGTFSIRRFYFWVTTWPAEDLGGVVFLVTKPSNRNEDDPENTQCCEAYVVDRDGRAIALLERLGNGDSKHHKPLARACLLAGHALDIPVSIRLEGPPMHGSIRRALDVIRNAEARGAARETPAFHKPFLTVYTVGSAVGLTLMLISIGRLILSDF